ncbi:MAG: nicotinate (nicotinamide) nucleotide adenylyltransferase [Spirochaetales bacterium]|nr:nicotinate (nicotinamide) nucleotide adenylyltransferase [Spirochaetales bacterium]
MTLDNEHDRSRGEKDGGRIAVFGGTFNPIHFGHLKIARCLKIQLRFDTVLLIPAFKPSHKKADLTTKPEHRLNMLYKAAADIEYLAVDDCEIRREGISFTIETIYDVYDRYRPRGKLALVIGDDLLAGFHTWKRMNELLGIVHLIVAHRISPVEREFSYPHEYLDNPIFDAASHEIRERVANGCNISDLVPKSVCKYIFDNDLYSHLA